MKNLHSILFLVLFCCPILSTAYNADNQSGFRENKGQVVDQFGKERPDVQFIHAFSGFKTVLRNNGISYELLKNEGIANTSSSIDPSFNMEDFKTRITRVDVDFVNANPIRITKKGRSASYFNYYNNASVNGILDVHDYSEVAYENVWPNIDLVFTLKDDMPKYDIVIHPGGNISDVKMKYTGGGLSIKMNELIIQTSLGSFTERIPIAFEVMNDAEKKVAVKMRLRNNIVSFAADYHTNAKLVIDPVIGRIWGTYYGTAATEEAYRVMVDKNNQPIIVGSVINSSLGLATTGAHQILFGGKIDTYLAKFTANGQIDWATYYGGTEQDWGSGGIDYDSQNNIYISGVTSSLNAISTANAFQFNYGGGDNDTYLVKFSPSGVRQWGTYMGSTGIDYSWAIKESGGYIYIAGNTTSDSGFATPGSYQPIFGGGYSDAFISKFDTSGNRIWTTFIGGPGNDSLMSLTNDILGNIYFCGLSTSTSGLTTAGAYQVNFWGGVNDAFFGKISASGNMLWCSYYGGPATEIITDIDVDTNMNFAIVGVTSSLTNIASSPTYLSTPNYSFFGLFDSSVNRQWCTYYPGTTRTIEMDNNQNIYIGGSSDNAYGLVPPGNHSSSFNGGTTDGFLIKFNYAGSRLWGTYYGGSDFERLNDLKLDILGNIYICGASASLNNIATAGTYQTAHFSNQYWDAYLVKMKQMEMDLNYTGNDTLCVGASVSVSYTSSGSFDPGNGFSLILYSPTYNQGTPVVLSITSASTSGILNGTIPSNLPTGSYYIAIASSSPFLYDHANSTKIFIQGINTILFNPITPKCDYATPFQLTGGLPPGGTYSGTGVSNGIFDPSVAGLGSHTITYTIIDPAGCTPPLTATTPIVVYGPTNANLLSVAAVCETANTMTLTGYPPGGSYSGNGMNGPFFQPGVAGPGQHTITYSFTDGLGCYTNYDSITITVNAQPAPPPFIYGLQGQLYSSYPSVSWYINGNTMGITAPSIPANTGAFTAYYCVNGCCSEASNEIIISPTNISSLENTSIAISNPSIENLLIKSAPKCELFLFNSLGKLLLSSKIENEAAVNISSYPDGLYFIQFRGKEFDFSRKIVFER